MTAWDRVARAAWVFGPVDVRGVHVIQVNIYDNEVAVILTYLLTSQVSLAFSSEVVATVPVAPTVQEPES